MIKVSDIEFVRFAAPDLAMPVPGLVADSRNDMPPLETLPTDAVLTRPRRPARARSVLPWAEGRGAGLSLLALPAARPPRSLPRASAPAAPAHGLQQGRTRPLRPARGAASGDPLQHLHRCSTLPPPPPWLPPSP